MTYKRFAVRLGIHMLPETIFLDLENEVKLTPNEVSKLLNQLYNTKEELQFENTRFKNQIARVRDKNERLHKDWDRLYQHLLDEQLMSEDEILKVVGYEP